MIRSPVLLDPFPQSCRWGALPGGFRGPFHACDIGTFVFDSQNHMAADVSERGTVRARGWGRIQYLPDPGPTMDVWEAWVAAAVGDATEIREVVRRMNTAAGGVP